MLLSARYIHAPRYARYCDECGKRIGPHIYLYGAAHDTERPAPLRLCLRCVRPESGTKETKIAEALAVAASRADAVAVEQQRLAKWNAASQGRNE